MHRRMRSPHVGESALNDHLLGIPNRQRISNPNRACKVISVRLLQEFGLKREETAEFVPSRN